VGSADGEGYLGFGMGPAFPQYLEEGQEKERGNQEHARGSHSGLLEQPVEPFKRSTKPISFSLNNT
jgi:hypothetical protein